MTANDVIARLVGRVVVIRDNAAGVYCGQLESIDLAAKTWALSTARQAHYWTGAAATPGLAVRGPGKHGSRIGPVMEVICGADLVSVMPCTDASAKVWADAEEWRP